MKVGVDQYTLHQFPELHGIELLELARAHGLDGVQFSDIRQVSPRFDPGEIREVYAHARHLGLYMELGIPCLNPHKPGIQLLQDGNGDLLAGLRRHLDAIAIARVGSDAIRCFVAGPGDRHGGPTTWTQQLADTTLVVRDLAPALRDHGLKLAFENHAEATVDELIALVEEVGPDIAGICLDTGNLVITLEDPLPAVHRAAPYTIATHLKDGILTFADDGLVYNARACGEGMLPITEILKTIVGANSGLVISIEDHAGLFPVPVFQDAYMITFPNQNLLDFAHLIRLARDCERKIAAGTLASTAVVESVSWSEQGLQRLDRGSAHVRRLVADLV